MATNGFLVAQAQKTRDWELHDITKEPTGYVDRTQSTISFNSGTRTFSISPVGAEFVYYIKGRKYTQTTTQTTTITDITGIYFIYFDGDVLTYQLTPPPFDLLYGVAFTGLIYWNAQSQQCVILGEERHGLILDNMTHAYLHYSRGAAYREGFLLDNIIVNGDGSTDNQFQFACNDGKFYDEDILHDVQNNTPQILSPIINLPIYYRIGTNGDWKFKPGNTIPGITPGSVIDYTLAGHTLLAYNQSVGGVWQLTEVTSNNYFLLHVFATNDTRTPVIGILGFNVYNNAVQARDGANVELAQIPYLPTLEFTPVGTLIIQVNASHTNTAKAHFVSTDTGAPYIDFRKIANITSSLQFTSNHSNLAGLSNDDHVQYSLVSGNRNYRDFVVVFNNSGVTINTNTGVVLNGVGSVDAPGTRTMTATNEILIGVTTVAILNGVEGVVQKRGLVTTVLDLTAVAINTPVYMTASGTITLTNTGLLIGYTVSQTVNGIIYLKI